MWINYFERQSRKSGTGPNIHNTPDFLHIEYSGNHNTVNKVLPNNILKFSDCSQIHHLICLDQHLIIFFELRSLLICQRNTVGQKFIFYKINGRIQYIPPIKIYDSYYVYTIFCF